jgi:hypothetical protein
MEKQQRGPVEKFGDIPSYSKDIRTGGFESTSLCMTAAHYHQSTNLSNGPRKLLWHNLKILYWMALLLFPSH